MTAGERQNRPSAEGLPGIERLAEPSTLDIAELRQGTAELAETARNHQRRLRPAIETSLPEACELLRASPRRTGSRRAAQLARFGLFRVLGLRVAAGGQTPGCLVWEDWLAKP